MIEVAVFGAGFVGLSTAIALKQSGADVVLVDKDGLGAGASSGNAGIIQSEAMVPYGMPRDIASLIKTLFGRDSSVALRFPGILNLVKPLASYYVNSGASGLERAAQPYSELIKNATQAHFDLADLAGAKNLFHSGGYRMRFTRQSEMDKSFEGASRMANTYGLPVRTLSSDEFLAAEPGIADPGVGAIEWSGTHHVTKPQQLLKIYFDYFDSIGGQLVQGDALSLSNDRSGWAFTTNDGPISVQQVVVATGAQTAGVVRHLGGTVPILPKRGYHAVLPGGRRLNAPLIDVEFGLALSPQGDRLRVATGVELGGKEALTNSRQLNAGIVQAARLFGTNDSPESTWSGLRPCIPDMLPVMGKSQRNEGLWYNFGHGYQGLTLGPLSGRLLARSLLLGQSIDPALSPSRFAL